MDSTSSTAQYFQSLKDNIKIAIALPLQRHSVSPDIESGAKPAGLPTADGLPPQVLHHQSNYQFSTIILALCFVSAVESLLLFLRLQNQHKKLLHFPLSFHFPLVITCVFAITFLEKFAGRGTETKLATLLRKIGIIFFAAAFFIAIMIPSPTWLRIVVSAIFIFTALVAAVSQRYCQSENSIS